MRIPSTVIGFLFVAGVVAVIAGIGDLLGLVKSEDVYGLGTIVVGVGFIALGWYLSDK